MTQGITSLPGAQQAPGQVAMPQVTPAPQAKTPASEIAPYQNMELQQLVAAFRQRPSGPLLGLITKKAEAEKLEQQQAQQRAMGAYAQQGPQTVKDMALADAVRVMQQPIMARHGGIMHGYAGGGAVAFQAGGSARGAPFFNDVGIFPVSSDMNPGETREEYIERKRKEAAESQEMGMKGIERLLRSVFPESKLRRALYSDTAPPVEPGTEGYSHEALVGLRSKPQPPAPVVAAPPLPPSGAPRAGAGAPAAPAPTAPTGGIADLAGPNIDPYLLAARDAQRLMAEAAMRGAQPTAEQLAARKGLDALMGDVVTERQAEEARRLAQAQKRIDEALERSKRAPLEDITYLGQMLEGMRGSKRFGEALAGAAAGAGRAQMARQEALRKAEERYDISRNDIATLANLRQQVQLDQAKAVEARASGDARSMQAAMLEVAKSKQQLAEFEAGLADKAEGRSLQRQQLALTASEGAADRALRERLAAAGAVPAEARFLEWLSSSPKNRKLYESVQEIKGEENRRLKLYEIYTKNKLSLGDMSFEDFLAGFKGAAGAGTAPPPGAVRVKGQ